jgi:conjugal transfer pilus assembly protein TraD
VTVRPARGIFQQRRLREYELEREVSDYPRPEANVVSAEAEGERGVVLAARGGGERALPLRGRLAVLSPERLRRHVLVCGATGSGKTETLLRLAWTLAKCSTAPVFYLDGKGDRETARRFVGLMADAGRETRVFPNQPLDGWRGEPHELRGRLMEIVDYAREGPAAWYRDVAKAVVGLACEHPHGPPRGSQELLARLDLEALKRAHGDARALVVLRGSQVDQVRLRYEAFFGETRGALDGGWAWEDTDAAYLLLESLKLREQTAGLARFLFEDFAHYFTSRKRAGQMCMMVVDEFSALAGAQGMAARVEQARGFNTALVLAPQVVAGMGGDAEAARILGSVETVVCHRTNTPEEIVALAGTRQMTEYSTKFSREGSTGEGTAMARERYKIDPNQVRGLPPGEAFVIGQGRAMRARILRAPEVSAPLPEPMEDGPGADSRPTGDVPVAETGAEKEVKAGDAESLPTSTSKLQKGDRKCKTAESSQWEGWRSTH